MSKSYFANEDGHPDSNDDGNFFGGDVREDDYDSGAELSTSPRPRDYGLNDEGGNRSDPFQQASEDVLGTRRMVRANLLLSPTFARTSASTAASASTAPIINIDDSPSDDNGASPLETDDIKVDFINLYSGSSQTCNKKYKKDVKIDIFYDILSVEDSILLGDSPPLNLKKVYAQATAKIARNVVNGSWRILQGLFMNWPSIFTIARNGMNVLFVIPRLEL